LCTLKKEEDYFANKDMAKTDGIIVSPSINSYAFEYKFFGLFFALALAFSCATEKKRRRVFPSPSRKHCEIKCNRQTKPKNKNWI
jgi:hypothetical protein